MQPDARMPTEGKTLVVGRHTMRFLHRAGDGGDALLEWTAPPAVPGPPLQIHRLTDDAFYVLEGTCGFQTGEQTIVRPSGAYVFVPRGLAHTYWNQGPSAAKLLILISPPAFAAYFEELCQGLTAAGDSSEAALRVRQALSATYDIEVVGPAQQANHLERDSG